uniref:DET1- and DDB1-associated protein 1 domain-containing protein n=1 Tax=Haptolina brevifila TaxID=156173 RepID=A0A7S2GB91_9EUKA|mmetsp:Transcript_31421/g.62795  ORF Transcript_31421/g.62795 Transcript_31421/m.62795 type:complete len:107 (+) Transcript_31421:120-440(+)|eukprot:CAMPEP_0174737644 /NCGR_PEP_ID=MMETSP1094-20130205/68644_1 /TAXON_ID=156173 /ORGANISM="Chrysochromulina brevifilum, Strain UTEX LB 985" /LENGTH=106 /DNA_ID=CAMNT_0015940907 /DNA_START=118 /DNA_END=438 /DNA_ORIENTATION=+
MQQQQRVSSLLANLPKHHAAPASLSRGDTLLKVIDRPALYIATHNRTEPPANQVVTTEKNYLLLRRFHAREEGKREKHKRTSAEPTEELERRSKSARRDTGSSMDV